MNLSAYLHLYVPDDGIYNITYIDKVAEKLHYLRMLDLQKHVPL